MAKGSGSAGRGGGGAAAAPAAASGVAGQALASAPLADFARATQRVANANPNELIDYKALIADVWQGLRDQGSTITLDQFKGRLLRANNLGLVTLSRADLAYALPRQSAVRSSRTTVNNSLFHFINLR